LRPDPVTSATFPSSLPLLDRADRRRLRQHRQLKIGDMQGGEIGSPRDRGPRTHIEAMQHLELSDDEPIALIKEFAKLRPDPLHESIKQWVIV
jgi:hypothetical protein